MLRVTESGLYCERGGFYIDPFLPVEKAVLTHGHGDHARVGSQTYYAAEESKELLRLRLGDTAKFQLAEYGETLQFNDVKVSFHPAGHILGSSQIRVEADGDVWVVSGDYKRNPDPTCRPFEVVPCNVFITEATFGLPIYRWDPGEVVANQIFDWWQKNAREERPSILFCYALGKAQRVLAELTKFTDKAVYTHGAVESLTEAYRKRGIKMLPTLSPAAVEKKYSFAGDLILAPPSAFRSVWMKRFKNADTGFASGWMRLRGTRRRKGYDRGFVLSDHADFNDLVRTARETGAKKVLVTHGSSETLSRYLNDVGIRAEPLASDFLGDQED